MLGTGTAPGGERVARLDVDRNGAGREVIVHPLRLGDERMRRIGVSPAYEVLVDTVAPGSTAEHWGLRAGDRLRSADGVPVASIELLADYLAHHAEQPVRLTVLRDGRDVALTVPPGADAGTRFAGAAFATNYRLLYQTPWSLCAQIVDTTFRTLWSLINPSGDISLSNLSGPIGIGMGFWRATQSEHPVRFAVWFAVLVNVNLAVLNLLPIPVLDGGHMLFATVQRLRGRALPPSFIMTTQSIFIVMRFSLLIYVSFFDVRRTARDIRADRAERAQEAPRRAPAPAPAR